MTPALDIHLDERLVAAWLELNRPGTFVDLEGDVIDGYLSDVMDAVFATITATSDDFNITETRTVEHYG